MPLPPGLSELLIALSADLAYVSLHMHRWLILLAVIGCVLALMDRDEGR